MALVHFALYRDLLGFEVSATYGNSAVFLSAGGYHHHIGLNTWNGTSQTKEIDTIEGSRNEYVSPDADVYAQSEMIICYYAGFGRYYKVVASGNGTYSVQRREFEEASPHYTPLVASFETIVVF